jgi:hypothetical protein
MSSSASSSSTPTLAAGPSNGAHPLLTNNDEKNRYLHRPVAAHRVLTCYHSVVIKVGMVGDSQIGKTSLMVKYVEGSFDEDYIQTLGTSLLRACVPRIDLWHLPTRRQLYGEDNLSAANDDHILHLGPWRTARVREHASTRLQ